MVISRIVFQFDWLIQPIGYKIIGIWIRLPPSPVSHFNHTPTPGALLLLNDAFWDMHMSPIRNSWDFAGSGTIKLPPHPAWRIFKGNLGMHLLSNAAQSSSPVFFYFYLYSTFTWNLQAISHSSTSKAETYVALTMKLINVFSAP